MRPEPRQLGPALALFALCLMACGEDGPVGDGPGDTAGADIVAQEARLALAISLAENVVLPTYRAFATACEALEASTQAYASSLASADRSAAQSAWSQAMLIWQQAELWQFGPAGARESVAGGQDLRDEIYSWPLVNRCRVDQETVEGSFADAAALVIEPVNVRGLDALEYLLYNASTDNACSPNSAINRDGQWQALGAELAQRRANHAQALAAELRVRAETLRDAWEPAAGDFLGEVRRAGQSGALYGSPQQVLSALSDAMFYVDLVLKDVKMAVPAGLSDCATESCPEALESSFSGASAAHMRANLVGFEALLSGSADAPSAIGFVDLLREVNAVALADDMTASLAAALDAMDALNSPLRDTLAEDPQPLLEAHTAVRALTDLLKTQFLSVLDLELPQRAEGDND